MDRVRALDASKARKQERRRGSLKSHGSVVVAAEDGLLRALDLLHQRQQSGVDFGRGARQAQLGALEQVEEARPSAEEGRELRRREPLSAAKKELLDHDVEGERHRHVARR